MHSLSICLVMISAGLAVPLYGGIDPLGYYFLDVEIGNQRMSVILDTGSEGLSVVCTTCTHCGTEHMDPFFDPQISSSVCNLRECAFRKSYLEGSQLTGRMYTDSLGLGSDRFFNQKFGCIDSETNLFLEQKANGILGLAPLAKSYLSQQLEEFSICLSRTGGDFYPSTISRVFNTTCTVPMKSVGGHYTVRPSEMRIGQISFVTEHEVLIDSGSTVTYFEKGFYTQIWHLISETVDAYKRENSRVFTVSGPGCWTTSVANATEDFARLLPPIELSFIALDNSTLTVKFVSYFFKQSDGQVCLTMASNEHIQRTDLGSSWLIGNNVTFYPKQELLSIQQNAACTERELSERVPVPPRPPAPENSFFPLIGMAFIFLSIAFCLIRVVRNSISATYIAVDPQTAHDFGVSSPAGSNISLE